MSSVEKTVIPAYLTLSFSASSILLAPTTTVREGCITFPSWKYLSSLHFVPVIAASGRPWIFPVIVVSKVLKSVWASIQIIPTSIFTFADASADATAIEWSPPIVIGKHSSFILSTIFL